MKRLNLLQWLGVFYLGMAILAIFGVIKIESEWGLILFVILGFASLFGGSLKKKKQAVAEAEAAEVAEAAAVGKTKSAKVKLVEEGPNYSFGTKRKLKKQKKL